MLILTLTLYVTQAAQAQVALESLARSHAEELAAVRGELEMKVLESQANLMDNKESRSKSSKTGSQEIQVGARNQAAAAALRAGSEEKYEAQLSTMTARLTEAAQQHEEQLSLLRDEVLAERAAKDQCKSELAAAHERLVEKDRRTDTLLVARQSELVPEPEPEPEPQSVTGSPHAKEHSIQDLKEKIQVQQQRLEAVSAKAEAADRNHVTELAKVRACRPLDAALCLCK